MRNLEREIAKMARKSVKELLTTKKKSIQITLKNLEDYLGVPKFRYGEAELEDQVGVVTGLAWTEVGGELLTVEGVMMPGKGKMTVTGNLRDVMKESIQAANAYVRSRSVEFGIKPPLFEKRDIHVHVPEGATPKDGPSAGVAMVTAIVSLMTGIPVKREVAMTGEITLRGRVLPIGGLKEKLLAALRAGIKTVIIPDENAKDLTEIPDELKKSLDIRTVSRMDEVVKIAFVRPLQPIVWEEEGDGRLKTDASGRRGPGRRDCSLNSQFWPPSRRFALFQWSASGNRFGPFLLIFRVFSVSHTPLVCESERNPKGPPGCYPDLDQGRAKG